MALLAYITPSLESKAAFHRVVWVRRRLFDERNANALKAERQLANFAQLEALAQQRQKQLEDVTKAHQVGRGRGLAPSC
jgi:hypothetical protein